MGSETRKFIQKLGFLMKTTTGETRSKDYLSQKISIVQFNVKIQSPKYTGQTENGLFLLNIVMLETSRLSIAS